MDYLIYYSFISFYEPSMKIISDILIYKILKKDNVNITNDV